MLGLWACAQSPSHVRLFENPTDCSPPGSSVHGISQATILEWVVISFSRRSSWPRDLTHVSSPCIGRWILYHWATREDQPRVISSLQIVYQTSVSACLLLLSHVWLYNPMDCSTPGSLSFTWSLLKLMSIESVMLSNHLVLCCPLLLLL